MRFFPKSQALHRKFTSLTSVARPVFVQPLSLTPFDSSPSRGASGGTVHFAGTAKASPTRSNGDDRRQWRKQGGAVGAAASRMRAAAKQTLGAATRLSAAASFFPFRQLLRDYQGRAALDSCLPRLESSGCFSGSLLTSKENISLNAKALCPAPPARKAFQKPFLALFWRAKENLTPLSSKTPAAPSPSPPAHFRGG